MYIYLIVTTLPLFFHYFERFNKKIDLIFYVIFFYLLNFLTIFRDKIGSDFGNYQYFYYSQKFIDQKGSVAPIIYYIAKFSHFFSLGFQGYLFFLSIIFLLGLFSICYLEKKKWLSLFIAIPYTFVVISWGFIEQGVAIGFLCFSIYYLKKENKFLVFLFILLATLTHEYSLIFFPIFLLSFFKLNLKFLIFLLSGISLIIVSFYIFILNNQASLINTILPNLNFYLNEVQNVYQLSTINYLSTAIKISLNLIPSIFYIKLYKDNHLKKNSETQFFLLCSFSCVFLFVTMFVMNVPSLRISVYFTFMQFLLIPRIIENIENQKIKIFSWLVIIIMYINFLPIWLTYSPNPYPYIPYRIIF